jgi:hypothetical protein
MSLDPFSKGQKIWVLGAGGRSRPALYVGTDYRRRRGPMRAHVVYEDTREPGKAPIERIVPRD